MIIVVDDNKRHNRIICNALINNNVCENKDIIKCFSAEEAMGFCDTLEESPDLIISNINLPGMSGVEFCDKIKSRNDPCSRIPIVLVSGVQERLFASLMASKAGAELYMPKPIRKNYLAKISSICINKSRARKERIGLIQEYGVIANE